MISLNSKQKRSLRSLGQKVQASVTIGKAGLSDEVLGNLSQMLDRHELVKVKLPAFPPAQREELALDIAQRTGSACAGTLGRTALFYRPSQDLPPEKRIRLE